MDASLGAFDGYLTINWLSPATILLKKNVLLPIFTEIRPGLYFSALGHIGHNIHFL